MEIIPKSDQQAPLSQKAVFVVLVISSLVIIFSIFTLESLNEKKSKDLASVKNTIAEERTDEKIKSEKYVLEWQRKINDAYFLIQNHSLSSKIFPLLQKDCHPRVWFSNFTLDVSVNSLSVSGIADSFTSLGQQLIIFNKEPLIKEAKLSNVIMNKRGQIEFGLNISVDTKTLK